MNLNIARTETGEPEIFRSIQGEGPRAGRVRTFIRLSGCNLHCTWCDTAYTWNWQGSDFAHDRAEKYDPAREMMKLSVDDAAARILAAPAEGVVITGGEPLLQKQAVTELAAALKRASPSLRVEIETNGTIAPSGELAGLIDLFVVSPKLAHSGNAPEQALKPDALTAFAALPAAMFKFVVREAPDLDAIAQLAAAHAITPSRIYVMAEGTESAALRARARALIGAVLARGFNFSDRLHIHLWGAKRGV